MSPETIPIVRSIQHTLRLLVIATCMLWLLVIVGGGYIVLKVSETADKANANAAAVRVTADKANATAAAVRMTAAQNRANEAETHRALCAFWGDLGKRVATTRKYLADHPQPVLLGAPRSLFEKQVADQQRTYRTLAGLRC